MSEQYQGTVQKVHSRNGRWSFLMDNEEWYGLGRKAPTHKDGSQVQDGDIVRFNYEDNTKNGRTYHNIVEGSLQAKKGDGPPPRQSSGQQGGKSNYQQKEQFWADKEQRDIDTQKRISMAGAYNTALNIVQAKIEHGLIKLGGKASDKIEAFESLIDDEACRLYGTFYHTADRHEELLAGGYLHGLWRLGQPPQTEKLEEGLDAEANDEPFGNDDDDSWD